MKKQILSFLALTMALTACESFESTSHSNPTPYVTEEGAAPDAEEPAVEDEAVDTYVTLDTSTGTGLLTGAELVDEIPEINIAVYEIDPDQLADQSETVRVDEQVALEEDTHLSADNELWDALVAEIDLTVGVIGAAPKELVQLCDANGNKIVVFQEAGESLYQSEIAKGILEASASDVDYLLIPVASSEMSDAVAAAVTIALSKDILVFDRDGSSM